jgi:hypothetical protein
MRELQALNGSVQLLQARLNKLALGSSTADESTVKSKVGRQAGASVCCPERPAAAALMFELLLAWAWRAVLLCACVPDVHRDADAGACGPGGKEPRQR